ncbi:MAG: cytochrome c biogenesis protein CcsA [Planctomycetes bacterium]|nr:cytochrome c biogenesis protein CcsA [Planctomycetota bacterium]MBL7106455.1 cytochrome c biogenesis protein CcsA [Phycisphaerae bacterium]
MAIKWTFLGLLIYLIMAGYLFAFLAIVLGKKKMGHRLYLFGFTIAAIVFGYRWYDTAHVPFQNLFEVFLSMTMLIYPLSIFCRRFLGVGREAVDMLIGMILLFPVGFVFSAEPQKLPPALQSCLFIPHVAAYLMSYVIMAKATVQAFFQLKARTGSTGKNLIDYEDGTYRMICLGFPLLTLGLIIGSWWGKLAWGDYWGWDPKELWSLASWLVYAGYFHFRYMFGKRYARINSSVAILGFVAILLTLLWVNLSTNIFPGLHNYAK